ncbi:MAG TPA: DUF2905 domain-containing protein [Chloroflexota bacterium]|jgi:hypothetical protein|nr:DUF2905 domain-containing protein [Chloroflexota bacterium]
MDEFARLLIVLGAIVVLAGVVLLLVGRIPFLGHLPGDIRIQTDGVSCFVPLATSLLLSVLLSLLLNLIANILQRH